ncbi:MAG: glycosyl transferase, family 2 [Sporomusa sp.]|jgi:glycosyltransferase involved in cell wall biosynthesis|nr:glycosyl transferase, family 2 [Sporomusa sp.]
MISVMMPVYNAARFLKPSIESILNQTEHDFELIIVNDGSTDNSEEIIFSFTDKRIRYVRQENKGEGAARQVALELAKGDYIAFQDHDDISLPYRLQLMKSRFVSPDIGLVHSDMMLIDDTDRVIGYWASSNIEKSRLLRFFLKVGTPFNNPTMMLRRESMNNFHYDATIRIGVDTDMVFNIAPMWNSVHIPEPLLMYRRYAQSLSRQGNYDTLALHVRKFILQHTLRELFPELAWDQQKESDFQAMASALMALFLARRGMIYDVPEWLTKAKMYESSFETKNFITAVENILSGNFTNAALLLEQCAKNDYVIENYLGEVKALQGNFEQAFQHFWRSLQLNPLYFEPAENLKALGKCRGGHSVDVTWTKFAGRSVLAGLSVRS